MLCITHSNEVCVNFKAATSLLWSLLVHDAYVHHLFRVKGANYL